MYGCVWCFVLATLDNLYLSCSVSKQMGVLYYIYCMEIGIIDQVVLTFLLKAVNIAWKVNSKVYVYKAIIIVLRLIGKWFCGETMRFQCNGIAQVHDLHFQVRTIYTAHNRVFFHDCKYLIQKELPQSQSTHKSRSHIWRLYS